MTKEGILKKHTSHISSAYFDGMVYDGECGSIYDAMDEYAKQEAIEFFKWYGVKMMGFIEYIKDIRPIVTSDEIEEKIKEFEGQPIDKLYELFTQSKQQ